MKHIRPSESDKFEKGAVTSWEYVTGSNKMNVARIKISGRYPETGYTINKEVDSIVHVISGKGAFGKLNENAIIIGAHDQVYIEKGEAYYFEGELEIIYCATPAWTPKQTELVD